MCGTLSRRDLLLVVTGLSAEARLVAGPGIVCLSGTPEALAGRLRALDCSAIRGVVSFGLAGGLTPRLGAGTLVVASAIVAGREHYGCASVTADIRATLIRNAVTAVGGTIAGCDAPVMRSGDKAALYDATEAVAVDTESHLAAAFAALHGVPLLVLRAVADSAGRDLPPLARTAIGPDGRLDVAAIGRELIRHPAQLVALPGTALAAARAMRTLRRVRAVLGPFDRLALGGMR